MRNRRGKCADGSQDAGKRSRKGQEPGRKRHRPIYLRPGNLFSFQQPVQGETF